MPYDEDAVPPGIQSSPPAAAARPGPLRQRPSRTTREASAAARPRRPAILRRVLAIGLNATMIVDYIVKDEITKGAAHAAGLHIVQAIFDFVVLGFYALCGLMAVRGKTWGFYVGMAAFALDTVISVLTKDFLGGAIHAFALFTMWHGCQALKQLNTLRRAAQTPASPWAA